MSRLLDMTGEYRLESVATLEGLEQVHELFADVSEPVEHLDLMLFETAAVEVIGNAIEHGRPKPVEYVLKLQVTDDALVGELDETSETWPPALDGPMPDSSVESGRGLALVRAVLDDFSFERRGDHNIWRLRRNLAR
jgi:serine/threonine-protein kinase RsbW